MEKKKEGTDEMEKKENGDSESEVALNLKFALNSVTCHHLQTDTNKVVNSNPAALTVF